MAGNKQFTRTIPMINAVENTQRRDKAKVSSLLHIIGSPTIRTADQMGQAQISELVSFWGCLEPSSFHSMSKQSGRIPQLKTQVYFGTGRRYSEKY